MELRSLVAGTSSLVAVMLIIFMLGGTQYAITGNIELGFPCVAGLELRAPESVDVYAGSFTSVNVTIYDVKCGVEHAILKLDGIPEEYYGVTPAYIASASPGREDSFTLDFIIPADLEPTVYSPTMMVWSNQGRFIRQSIDVNILEPLEKPEVAAPQPVVPESEELPRASYFLNQGLAVLLLVTAILGAFGFWYIENKGIR